MFTSFLLHKQFATTQRYDPQIYFSIGPRKVLNLPCFYKYSKIYSTSFIFFINFLCFLFYDFFHEYADIILAFSLFCFRVSSLRKHYFFSIYIAPESVIFLHVLMFSASEDTIKLAKCQFLVYFSCPYIFLVQSLVFTTPSRQAFIPVFRLPQRWSRNLCS
jgi:hypothetical protein